MNRLSPRNQARPVRGPSGFTLLELLVALAIFAIMAVAIYSSLGMLMETSTRLDEEGGQLKDLQTAMRFMERDLDQVVARPVRSNYDEELPALSWPGHEDRLEFTADGRANPRREPRCSLQRLAYKLEDGKLLRLSWPVLDRSPDSTPFSRPLLSGVTHFEVSFLSGNQDILTEWPPPGKNLEDLPKAIRVVLEVEGWGRLERIYLPAGGK